MDHFLARADAAEHAQRLVGLAYPSATYEQLLFPHDPPAVRHQMARDLSGCGLTCEEILRAVGADAAVLDQPYGPRARGDRGAAPTSLTWLEQWARSVDAWVDTTTVDESRWQPLEPGDMWRLGRGNGKDADSRWYRGPQARFEHVGTVVEAVDDFTFGAVEGGQPGILRKERELVIVEGELWICVEGTPLGADGRPSKGARVAGYLSLGSIPLREVP